MLLKAVNYKFKLFYSSLKSRQGLTDSYELQSREPLELYLYFLRMQKKVIGRFRNP